VAGFPTSTALSDPLLSAQDGGFDFRLKAVGALSSMKCDITERTPITLLGDSRVEIRAASATSLGKLRTTRAIPHGFRGHFAK